MRAMIATLFLLRLLVGSCQKPNIQMQEVPQKELPFRPPSDTEMKAMFKLIDADGDDFLTLEEGLAYVTKARMNLSIQSAQQIMEKMDTDKNGLLSLEEFQADLKSHSVSEPQMKALEEMFTLFDEDADKVLSHEESASMFSWLFQGTRLDADRNSKISLKEFQNLTAGKLDEQKATAEVRQKTREKGEVLFKQLDTDGDKQLSPKEYFPFETGIFAAQEACKGLFEVADKDYDEDLSEDELIQVSENEDYWLSAAYYHMADWIDKEGLTERWRDKDIPNETTEEKPQTEIYEDDDDEEDVKITEDEL
mmetsp:Transcript_96326/g.167237  ORF Transcript_96326/g.167237 Transcript_96326/m.167237 type:complete len:308 (-) Transcript_96326:104-1027(-)